ncbi:MAG TPA: type II toxin-antitoxin system death-on-curing family toxin [Thermoanaerobaculia bacterium]|nr:type II toxin-antitoxin system death-on-curing family toxin [Thermoanaerobaculia bacterium]
MDPNFLTLEEILAIHEDRVRKYGGSSGVRDLGLLESAIGTVTATFGGEFLHQSIFEMAAAYLFHICKNHPFIDGNKRTALACSLAFLRLNRVRVRAKGDALYELVMAVAEGRATKAEVAVFLQQHAS